MGKIAIAMALIALAGFGPLRDDPDGTKAGEERTIAGIKLCWCPPGTVHDGQPARRAGAAAGRGPGRGDADQGLLDRQVRGDAGRVEAGRRQAAGRADGGAARGGRLPVGNVNFAEAEAFCRKLTELARTVGRAAGGLGVPAAHRGPVGVRLPGRDDDRHRVRRLAQQQAGELQGQALQRGRGGAVAGQGGQGRQLPGQRLGPARHARQHLRVVPGLVPREAARRRRPRPVRRRRRRRRGTGTATSRGSRRGGAWTDDGWPCRSAFRLRFEPERRYDHIGFRVVLVKP